MLILHYTYDHWSVTVLTVSERFIYSHFLIFFFQIGCFLHSIQSVYPICFVLFVIMDLPYICDHQVRYSAGGLFIVLEVVLNLVYLSILSGLAALMSADIALNL